jgi:sugar (pentulose or hexulose) kinase
MQIAADVFDLAAERPQIAEASALGAAMLAAAGSGWHATCRPRRRRWPVPAGASSRGPTPVRTYDALYREVYRPLYKRLEPLYRRIRAITGYPA